MKDRVDLDVKEIISTCGCNAFALVKFVCFVSRVCTHPNSQQHLDLRRAICASTGSVVCVESLSKKMDFFRRRRHDDRDEYDYPPSGTHGTMGGGRDDYNSGHHGTMGGTSMSMSGHHNGVTDGGRNQYTNGNNGPAVTGTQMPMSGHQHGAVDGARNQYTNNHNGPLGGTQMPANSHHPDTTNGAYTHPTAGHGHHTNTNGVYDDRHNGLSRHDNMDSTYNDHHHKTGGRPGVLSRRKKERTSRPLFDLESGNFNRRPSFGQWLKMTWLDLVTMAAMGAVGLGVYMADPAPSRSFPITFSDGEVVYPEVAYPLRNEIIPIWAAALMASLIPILIFLVMQIRIRSFWDVNNATIGLLYSLITAAVFQVFLKWLIGGLRPHFLAVCDPDPAIVNAAQGSGNGFQGLMFDRSVCRGNRADVNDALESFPSGHATAAFAGFMFLYYYLNAKLKVWSNYHPAMWKLLATYAPVLGATLIAGAMTIDEYHHWYDVLFGAIIGTVMATSSYRMVYASVWDFRCNHVPLTRHTPFSYGAGAAGAGGFDSAVFTRKAGWGYEEAFGGAPFDAAYHLRGQVAGFNTNVHSGGRKEKGGLTNGDGHRHDDVEHNAATATGGGPGVTNGTATRRDVAGGHDRGLNNGMTGSNLAEGTHHQQHGPGMLDDDRANWGYPEGAGDSNNRYRHHRKSMERKAVPQ